MFLVRRVQGIADLPSVLHRSIERQWAFKWRAVDELHHQVIRADVVELADMRMIQRGDEARFARETIGVLLF